MTYSQQLFHVYRKTSAGWVAVPGANFECTTSYEVHDNTDGLPPSNVPTLVYSTETATITQTFHGPAVGETFMVGDEISAIYNGKEVFHGTVEQATVTTVADPEMHRHGQVIRTDVEFSCGGYFADMLSRTVSWGTETLADGTVVVHGPGLPQELWETRIQRWVAVTKE